MDTTEINSITKKIDLVKSVFDNHELSVNNDKNNVLSEMRHEYMDSEFISDEENSTENSESNVSIQSIPQIKYDESNIESSTTVSKMTSEVNPKEVETSTNYDDIKSNASIVISEFSSQKNQQSSNEKSLSSSSSASSRLFVKNPKHSKKSNRKHKK